MTSNIVARIGSDREKYCHDFIIRRWEIEKHPEVYICIVIHVGSYLPILFKILLHAVHCRW